MAGTTEALRQILGKTIKGVVVKRDLSGSRPAGQVMLVFTDDTSFELYSDRFIMIASGLDTGGMEKSRASLTPPKGTMEIHMDVSLDE